MADNQVSIQDFIEIIKCTLEKHQAVKICRKFYANKALQIQMNNGDYFNLCIIKLDEDAYKIKRR